MIRHEGRSFRVSGSRLARYVSVLLLSLATWTPTVPAAAQEVECPDPEGQDLVMPPEFVSSGGILKGTINLIDEIRRLPRARPDAPCQAVRVRVFEGEGLTNPAPAAKLVPGLNDAIPGPTLRARIGDLVQLRFVNMVDANRFDRNVDACTKTTGPRPYPESFGDVSPNCLHASSTANIHFHGTHTNPNATGDNVYLQIRPLPRDNQGELTMESGEAMAGFEEFFAKCAEMLQNPLTPWPLTWSDMPKAWIDTQTRLLVGYQQKNPTQRLWDENQKVMKDSWPVYYIGAFPYCFALPSWPPPPGRPSPVMGQAPGTHWYHAHKHGSTAINVANGMTGAFIIEGQYDDDLNAAYRGYVLEGGIEWNARAQKILVLNQLSGSNPNLLRSAAPVFDGPGVDFSVNGRLRPRIKMQPGEVQLWRIINTSGRTAAYFMPPEGLAWRQLAQDGVQFDNGPYQQSLNKPFYMAPANRVDLLVQAPLAPGPKPPVVRIQNVMARRSVKPVPIAPDQDDPVPGTELLTVEVTGAKVKKDGQPTQMPFLATAPVLPAFLRDSDDDKDKDWRQNNYLTRTLVFDTKEPTTAGQHTINEIQFDHGSARLNVPLGTTEEWTIKNLTIRENLKDGMLGIDHPLHIHINPFQVTEFFDPNESLVDPTTGKLEAVKVGKTTEAVLRYVTDEKQLTDPNNPFAKRQCYIDPKNRATWSVEGARSADGKPCQPQEPPESKSIWRDVFAIPSARQADGETIPGYYKMRSRFVDYPGLYVMHCHILIHEDRGMMYSVEVVKTNAGPVRHH